MRVMMMVKGDAKPGQMPSEEMLAAMAAYNEELIKAGAMLDGSGLHPSVEGVRVRYSEGKRTVVDGPFAESKELVAGYWILQVKSLDEAIEWAKRVPFEAGAQEYDEPAEIEVRQLFELEDFGDSPAVQKHKDLRQTLSKDQ
jgi:hypothetical protein